MCGIKERFYESKSHSNHRSPLIGTAIISGCGSEKQPEDTSLKVRTITIGEESGTTSAGYAGTIHNKTETNLAFQIGGRVINKFVNVGDTSASRPKLLKSMVQIHQLRYKMLRVL